MDLNNKQLSQLMRKAKLEMPFSDFEETVMLRINRETARKPVLSRDRKLSIFFFLLGTCFGLIINSLLQRAQYTFLDMPPATTILLFQVVFVLLFLVQLERNLHLMERWKNQRKPT